MKILTKFKPDLYLWISLGLTILSAVLVVLIALTNPILPKRVPLFYSLPWGEMQLASQSQIFIIPATICLISLVNLIILGQLHTSQAFFKKLLSITSLICALVLLIAIFKVVFVFL